MGVVTGVVSKRYLPYYIIVTPIMIKIIIYILVFKIIPHEIVFC